MIYTESHFGLEIEERDGINKVWDGLEWISLPLSDEVYREFEEAVGHYLERVLGDQELADLKELLQ